MIGFPCVEIFCVYAATGLSFCYLMIITFFGAFLALCGHLELSNRHSLLFTKVQSKSLSEESSWLYRLLFVGGIDPNNPSHPKDNKDEKMMAFFRTIVAPTLNHTPFKIVILLMFALYLGFSGIGIYNMKEGLQLSNLAMEDSHVVPHFDVNDKYFRDFTYRLQVVIPGQLEYHNKTVQQQLFKLLDSLEASPYISNNADFRQFWLPEFLAVAEENFILFNITTKEQFMEKLGLFLEQTSNFTLSSDVRLNEDKESVKASRLFLQTNRISDSQEEMKMLMNLRSMLEELPFEVILFNPLFYIFDQFAEVFNQTLNCVCLCVGIMAIVILIFIPSKICVVWVIFAVVSVEVGVLGIMAFWNINLDVISMIVLIMGIGFSVDFSAHISYHYLSADEEHTPEEKLAHCLHALGPPILQGNQSVSKDISTSLFSVIGAATTILSVLPMISHPSYVIITFTKMIILVIVLGLLHSMLLLPVLLTMFGPGSCYGQKKPRPKTHSQINIMSPIATVSETFIYETGKDSSLRQYTMRKTKCISPDMVKNNFIKMFTEADKEAPVNNLHLSFFKPSDSDVSDSNISEDGSQHPVKVISSRLSCH